jgi:acetate kinase
MGVEVDASRNSAASTSDAEVMCFSTDNSPFQMLRVLTDEEVLPAFRRSPCRR